MQHLELRVQVERRHYERYLRLVGYMFEQSIPMRGIPYKHPITYNEPIRILLKVISDQPLYVRWDV